MRPDLSETKKSTETESGVFAKIKDSYAPALFSTGLRKAAVLFTARSLNSLVSLLFSLIAGRILTVEDHGIFSQAMARIVIIQALTEVGLQYSLVRFLTPALSRSDSQDAAGIVRASLQLKMYAFLITGAACLIVMVFTMISPSLGKMGVPSFLLPEYRPDAVIVYWFIFLGGFGLSILSYLDAVMVSHDSFFRLSAWLPSISAVRIFLLIFLALMEGGEISAEHVIFAFAFGPYISVILYFFLFPASFFFRKAPHDSWKLWMKNLFQYNLWIVAASFFSILSDWMEVLLIGKPADTGLYNAARMPMQGFLILLATMQSILLPRFSKLEGAAQFEAFFRKIYKYLIPGSFIFLPGFAIFTWFIPAWYGPEYVTSVKIFYILYPNFLLRLFFAPLGTALFALDKPRLIAIEAGLRMVTGLSLNLILIPNYGIFGAAWASLFSQFSGWIFLIFVYYGFFKRGLFPGEKDKAAQ